MKDKKRKVIYTIDVSDKGLAAADAVKAQIGGAVVPIIERRGSQTGNIGTAFCIAQFTSGESLFVTARHVIDEFSRSRPSEGEIDPENHLMILLPSSHDEAGRKNLQGVFIEQVSFLSENSDVAILVVNPRNSTLSVVQDMQMVKLSFRRPIVHERTLGIGFKHLTKRGSPEAEYVEYRLTASAGLVEEVHQEMLATSSFVDFPSFRVGAEYLHSMSGGPIFDETGNVIGIISVGYGSDPPIGYAALPVSLAQLNLDLLSGEGKRNNVSFFDLIRSGIFGQEITPFSIKKTKKGIRVIWHKSA